MMNGVVNSQCEATIQLCVFHRAGPEHRIEAVVDTGFTGSLTIRPALIRTLDLDWLGREQGLLGDGSTGLFEIYAATVQWDGQRRRVEAIAAVARDGVASRA